MKFNGNFILSLLIVVLPMLVSCREELCYDHYPVINVSFNWEQEWEREYGEYHGDKEWDNVYYGCGYDELRPGVPEWINMVSYYDDGRRSDSFISPDGRSFIVEAGESRSVLLYNGDTEFIIFSDVASLTDARASTTTRSRSRSSLAAIYQNHRDARTTNPPDILYSAYIDKVPALNNHDQKHMPVKMQPLVYTYVIRYEFEYGFENVYMARGALGGMAESVYLRTGVTSEQSSILLYDCEVKSDCCMAYVHSFGAPGFPDAYYGRAQGDNVDRPYTLNLEVLLKNGKTVVYDEDVSDQLKNQPRGGVIILKGLRVEDDISQSESGFQVDVVDWPEPDEVIPLPIGGQPGAVY